MNIYTGSINLLETCFDPLRMAALGRIAVVEQTGRSVTRSSRIAAQEEPVRGCVYTTLFR